MTKVLSLMNDETLVKDRQGLLKYILYQYNIDDKEAVWLLNYLKDHAKLKNFRVRAPGDMTEGLTITRHFKLFFKYQQMIITDADVIINLLSDLNDCYYLYFAFDDEKVRQLETMEQLYIMLQKREIFDDLTLTATQKESLVQMAQSEIEWSLVMKEKEDFMYFSQLLKHIKE